MKSSCLTICTIALASTQATAQWWGMGGGGSNQQTTTTNTQFGATYGPIVKFSAIHGLTTLAHEPKHAPVATTATKAKDQAAAEEEGDALASCLVSPGTIVQELETLFTGLAQNTPYGYRSGMTVLAHLMRELPMEVAACEHLSIDQEAWGAVFGDAGEHLSRVASPEGFKLSKSDPRFKAAVAAAKADHWKLAGAKLAAYLRHAGEYLA